MKHLLITLTLFLQYSIAATLLAYDSVPEIGGNDLIQYGDSIEAANLITEYEYIDPAYFLMKNAELAIREEDYSSAKRYLLDVTLTSETFDEFAFRRLGDIELLTGNIEYAIVSYRTAAERTTIAPYQLQLRTLADSLGTEHREELLVSGWHAMLFPDFIGEEVIDTVLPQLKARLNQGVTKVEFDSLVAEALKIDRAITLTNTFRDTSLIQAPFPTKDIYEHSRYLSEKGFHSNASQWLHYALGRDDFRTKVNQAQYTAFRCALNYKLKNWQNAVDWGKKYNETYGSSSGIVYNIARSYRKLGQSTKANYWYSEHVRRFPSSSRTYNILWYQAWIFEDTGNFDTAIVRYDDLATKFPAKKYGDDAAFRVGLLHFRQGNYTESIEAFESFYSKFRSSKLSPGSFYWIGRANEELGRTAAANSAYNTVTSYWPLNYYAWRSRQAMGTMDEFELTSTPFDTWFETLKERSSDVNDTLASFDAAEQFKLAVQLGTIGYKDEAMFLAEPIEIRAHKNYAQLYELSRFYDVIGEHYKAFTLSKSIYYSIPRSLRSQLPVEFLSRLYPEAYPEEIAIASEQFDIEPQLVRSIMRQESMFKYDIFSYVGAAGLMQIMPYTGEEIANDLNVGYTNDTLLDPATNVYFGTYYIGKLLRKWDGHYVKSIASYNGGPHNVSKWVRRSTDVLDDEAYFSECIGFSETRNYVKRVLENYWIYHGIDGILNEEESTENEAVEVATNSTSTETVQESSVSEVVSE